MSKWPQPRPCDCGMEFTLALKLYGAVIVATDGNGLRVVCSECAGGVTMKAGDTAH